jgi:multidrug efflux system membrane fusion protein
MRKLMQTLLTVTVLAAAGWYGMDLLRSAPDPVRRPPRPNVPTVEVQEALPTDYRVVVPSRGSVSPRTQSTLIPEVSGRIVEVAPAFRPGGFFEADELLLRIDETDYRQSLVIARAELAQARLNLREEQAQAEQARQDWDKLGMGGKPGDLTLRRPQLENRRAEVAAAQARMERAETDLERTRIRAPYAGRVLEKNAGIGQYVTPGSLLATLYAVDYVEIRLPINSRQARFIELPESYRGETNDRPGPTVEILADGVSWPGRIVRTEGAVDLASRQLYLVAQVDDPYGRRPDGRPPLKVGQFVEARIRGLELKQVYVLPRRLFQGRDRVFVIAADGRVQRRRVVVIWQDQDHFIVNEGLQPGERLSTSPLPFVADGARVKLAGAGENARDSGRKSKP